MIRSAFFSPQDFSPLPQCYCIIVIQQHDMVIAHNKENFNAEKTIDFAQIYDILSPERSCGIPLRAERSPHSGKCGAKIRGAFRKFLARAARPGVVTAGTKLKN